MLWKDGISVNLPVVIPSVTMRNSMLVAKKETPTPMVAMIAAGMPTFLGPKRLTSIPEKQPVICRQHEIVS